LSFYNVFNIGRFVHIVWLMFSIPIWVFGQDIPLANEYLQKEDFQKAKIHYELAIKKNASLEEVYPGYVQSLIRLNENSMAEKFFRKLIKNEPTNIYYKYDYILFLKRIGSKDFEKITQKTIKECLDYPQNSDLGVSYLLAKKEYELLELVILAFRYVQKNTTAYYKEMAEVKKTQGNQREMSEELLMGFMVNNEPIEQSKYVLQNYLTEPAEMEHFRILLLELAQSDPLNNMVTELLLWLFVQQKDFSSAAIQAKALDKRYKLNGEKQEEVADLALENKEYDVAIRIYETIVKDYPRTTNYYQARAKSVSAKEQKIKSKFPVDKNELYSLAKNYLDLISETNTSSSTQVYKHEADLALLYGFYLNKLDSAIMIMNQALKKSAFDKKFQAQAKLHLGDLYLLDNQPWESTLLYSQVELMEKDQLLGHEAKLRNAKLYYYQGDFKLAEEQMDVLKLATSREISNDAIQLSVLIQDNIAEDTTGYALKRYAAVELLIFQNKWKEANKELEELYKEYKAKSLKDDILFLEAKIARQFGQYQIAIVKLEQLLQEHTTDILADDAAYQIAQMYEYQLKDREKAMECYNKIVTQFPASIHVVEARKKYREIRGDKVN
jgi:outer membrane protein assembly factor BamD (BamD/ComL family)